MNKSEATPIKTWLVDGLNVVWLAAAGFATTAFYLSGKFITANYSDWVFYAYRTQSIMQHGLLSWDYALDNGISYWRGYQLLPGLLTAAFALVFRVSASQAMVLLTIVMFVLFHIIIYLCMRALKHPPLTCVILAAMSFAFTGLWVLVGSYSVLLAIVFTPPMLLLWYVSGKSRTLGLLFAVAVGASIYVHPLLAISFGLLWLVGLLRRRDLRPSQLAQELFAMASVSVFYWYGLLFADAGYIAPYQLTKAFMYTVIAGSKFGPVFFIIAIIVALAATFASRIFSTKSQILFWFTAGLYGLMQLNHFTDLVDFLNRYQISRLNFFVAVALLFVAADFLTKTVARVPSVFTYCLLGLAVGIGQSQTLIDGSMYGFSPSASVPDPVGAFENTQHGPLNGSIYIYSSISSAYYHPGLRYSNGYNDQLLPQLLNDRLNGLLSQISPTYDVTDTDVSNISAYVKVLGIGYIFLPPNSAYIQPLLSSGNFKLAAHVTSTQFDYVILKPTWPIVNAFTVNSVQEKFTASEVIPAVTSTDDAAYAQLDLATQQLAAIEYNPASTPVALSWPAPDQLRVTFPPSRSDHYVFVNQSYSRDWHATGATAIKRASVGLMILAVPAGVTSVELQHTWGLLPVIQLVLGLIVLCIIGWSIIRRSKHA